MLASVIRNSLIFIGLSVAAVMLLRDNSTLFSRIGDGQTASPVAVARPPANAREAPEPAAVPGQMVIKAGAGGHFFVEAQIDERNIGFLVDTGASMVALSPADAETLGYAVHQLDYSLQMNTANGIARAAPVVIDEIAVGDIVVRDVPAVVMDTPMNGSLLGMTFLRKLAGFEVKGDRLILRW